MRHDAQGPVVVLSPHFDDAVLSAWSVLRRPVEVRVINVCAAVPPPGHATPWDRLTGAGDGAERVRERIEEDRAALARAARRPVALDFLDDQYRDEALEHDALVDAIVDAAPATSELWAPAGIGAHSDHVQVRDAALAIAGEGGPPLHLYAELPYAVRYGWPEWVTGRRPRDELDRDAWMRTYLPDGATVPGDAHRLTGAEMRRKLEALRLYRTQWMALDSARVVSRRRAIRYEASFAVSTSSMASSSATKRSSENRSA